MKGRVKLLFDAITIEKIVHTIYSLLFEFQVTTFKNIEKLILIIFIFIMI